MVPAAHSLHYAEVVPADRPESRRPAGTMFAKGLCYAEVVPADPVYAQVVLATHSLRYAEVVPADRPESRRPAGTTFAIPAQYMRTQDGRSNRNAKVHYHSRKSSQTAS